MLWPAPRVAWLVAVGVPQPSRCLALAGQIGPARAELCRIFAIPRLAAADGALSSYAFPDGSGTIGLPAGWSCRSPSAVGPVLVAGPAGQQVLIGGCLCVHGEQSPLAQTVRRSAAQTRAMAARMGLTVPVDPGPAASPDALFGEADEPVEMHRRLFPQSSAIGVDHGDRPERLGRIDDCAAVTATQPDERAATAVVRSTEDAGTAAGRRS